MKPLSFIWICLILAISFTTLHQAAKAENESDDVQKACYIEKEEMKCLEISNEDIEVLKSCAFLPYPNRNKCAEEKSRPYEDVVRFVYWI